MSWAAGESSRRKIRGGEQGQNTAHRVWYAVILLALLAVRVLFLMTHAVQEDAYITFRSAFHWADLGEYSYNLGQHNPAVTSTLYGPLAALLRLVLGRFAITATAAVDSLLVLLAAFLLAACFAAPGRSRAALWALFALLPEALLIGESGMETGLLCLALAALLWCVLKRPHGPWLLLCFLVLPLVRPDAALFCGIFALGLLARGAYRSAGVGAAASAAGAFAMLAVQRLETGYWLPLTARAKVISYHPEHTAGAIGQRLAAAFVTKSIYVPVETKFLVPVSFLFTLMAVAAVVFLARYLPRGPQKRAAVVALAGTVFLVPLAYAVEGILFPWYIWPSSWIAQCVAGLALLHWAGLFDRQVTPEHLSTSPPRLTRRQIVLALAGIPVLMAFVLLRLTISWSQGVQDFHYRADVGRWLHRAAAPQDTLFLEPAGYIPFYAGLRTDDEVGLGSAAVLEEKLAHPDDWWIRFLEDDRPTWTIQRSAFRHRETYQHIVLSPDQATWFDRNYCLVRTFSYQPSAYAHNRLEARLLAMGTHEDFLVFRLRSASVCP